VLNFVARAFLYGKGVGNFEAEMEVNEARGRSLSNLQVWRKKGPVGKLHNVIVFIRITPQRREQFMNLFEIKDPDLLALLNLPPSSDTTPTEKNMVVRDNDTRWNSVYFMINRALERRPQIDNFTRYAETLEPDKRVPQENRLTEQDWLILTEIHNFLKPLYDLTIYMESRAPNAANGSL